MKKQLTIALSVIALTLFLTGTAGSAPGQIRVRIKLLYATDGKMPEMLTPMKKEDPLYRQLTALFQFKKYGVAAAPIASVLSGKIAEIGLWEDMYVALEPEIAEGGSIRLEIDWGVRFFNETGKEIIETILQTTIAGTDGATTILGGKRIEYEDTIGIMILAITPSIIK